LRGAISRRTDERREPEGDWGTAIVININLLPSAQRPPAVTFDRGLALGLTLVAVELLVLGAFVLYENNVINDLNNQFADISHKVLVEQQAVKEVDDLRDQAQQLKAKAELLERIKQSPLQLAEILTDISNQSPTGVWFTGVTVNRSVTGGAVNFVGRTSTLREVADLMLNLDGSPIFGNATLSTTTQTILNGQTSAGGVGFTVVGQLSPAVIGQ
jgi:Tfp pilus assembly protein PilN